MSGRCDARRWGSVGGFGGWFGHSERNDPCAKRWSEATGKTLSECQARRVASIKESSLVLFTEVRRFTRERRHLYLCEGVRTMATLQGRTS